MRRPNESAYTDEMRIYGDDMHGNRVIVGLTPEESEEYEDIMDQMMSDRGGHSPYQSVQERSDTQDRYLALHDKHEHARLQVLAAEIQLRQNPTRN